MQPNKTYIEEKTHVPKFYCRASAIGKIMTDPQGKSIADKMEDAEQAIIDKKLKRDAAKPGSKTAINYQEAIDKLTAHLGTLKAEDQFPKLSSVCISYLRSWLNEHLYQRRSEFTSKYTDKGTAVEDDAIIYASGYVDGMGLCSKNTERFFNDYINGEPDVLTDETVFDIKASWSHDTFPLYETELPEKDYKWQVIGYMGLTGLRQASVLYVLMSAPEAVIQREARFRLGYDYTEEQYLEFADTYRYDTMPPHLRLKEFKVPFSQADLDAIYNRVEQCRKYIDMVLLPEIEKNAKIYTEQTEEVPA